MTIEHIRPHTPIISRQSKLGRSDQINREMVLKHADIGRALQRRQQGPHNLPAGGILGMQHPAFGMAAFFAQRIKTLTIRRNRFFAGKFHTQVHQFLHSRRPLLHDCAHHLFPTEPRPGTHRIGHMKLHRIRRFRHRRNTTLGILRIGLGEMFLGDNGDPPVRRHF